jgi:hypothetical protein
MNTRKRLILVLSNGGMEIIWRYAWAFFLIHSILKHPLPLWDPLVIFTAGYLVTIMTANKTWPLYKSLTLHMVGFTFAWLLAVERFFYPQMPFFTWAWLSDWFKQLHDLEPFFIQLLFLGCLLPFWIGGRSLAKRGKDYLSVCLHFDKGIGALFLLLLVQFIARHKGVNLPEDPLTRYMLLAFFSFGLTAIGLSRDQRKVKKTFRRGYYGIGIIAGFIAFVLIAAFMLTSLLLPYLTLLADSAQEVLQEAAQPMVPHLIAILRFIFAPKRYRQEMAGQPAGGSESQMMPDAEIGGTSGLVWMVVGILWLLGLVLCGYLIYLLLRWLLQRNAVNEPRAPKTDMIQRLLAMLAALCRNVWLGLLRVLKKCDSAAAVYSKMLRWGRRSGLPAVPTETPIEYGSRLSTQIPELKGEIHMIIAAFNTEIYGSTPIDEDRLSRILLAQRTMHSPRFWRSRVKGWFLQQPALPITSQPG